MLSIRSLESGDWPSVRQIYTEGIATGEATLETSTPDWEVWDKSHTQDLRYVAVNDKSEVVGWTALTPVSGRCVYAGVAEVSVYVGSRFRGQQIGDMLLKHLIAQSEKSGYWTLQAGIFPENVPSMKLHEKNGFRLIGFRENIGRMNDVWRNVNLLERRSKVVGIG